MAKTPEDIIELTDIIEHGPDAPKPDGAGGGVDLSFERELEDLFAEPSATPPQSGELAGDGQDIDLDGLDALLAEAEKNGPAGADLPELTDDFLDPSSLGDAGSPEADLDALLGQDLSADSGGAADTGISFDAALGATAAVAAAAPEPQGPAPSSQALEALSDRLDKLEEKLTGMGDTLAQSFKSMLDEALAAFKAGLPEPAQAAPALDTDAVEALVAARLEEFKAALPQPAEPAVSMDEEALAARIRDEILSSLPEPAPAAPALDTDAVDALVAARLDAFKDALPKPPAPVDEEALADRIRQAVAASLPAPQAPDLSGYVTREALEALRQELLAEVRKTVPAAAAKIIREEIQALVQDMD